MSIGVLIKEHMSGWLKLDDSDTAQDFAFSLRAFTPRVFSLTAPRAFRGTATLGDHACACEGELTLFTHGPHYWLDFNHPELGRLHVEGKKTYSLKNLTQSMTVCPLEVFRDGTRIGHAEVAYRDSMLAFPFTALRLTREENAFGEYGEA